MSDAPLEPFSLRRDFPMLKLKVHGKPFVYFDSAATALKPQSVIDTMSRFYAQEYGTVHRGIYQFAQLATERYHAARRRVQAFLHAEHPEEIVFTRGTTDGINLVARSLGESYFSPGDEILLPETEHHSNIVPWQMLQQRLGVRLIPLPVDDHGVIIYEEFLTRLSPKTKLLSVAHISNFTGAVQPIERLIPILQQRGVLVLLDAAQSAPHMELDVQQLGVDFLCFSGHKAFGPTGIGVLYGKKKLLDQMPPIQGGGDMIEEVRWEGSSYQEAPLKFEAGTPMIAEVMGLSAALDWIDQVGRKKIERYEKELLLYATEGLKQISQVRILGEAAQKGAILSFTCPGIHPLDLGTLLDLEGFALRTGHLCTQIGMERFGIKSALRLSFAPYNTQQEIDRFFQALVKAMVQLK